jgi:hypothetical protein
MFNSYIHVNRLSPRAFIPEGGAQLTTKNGKIYQEAIMNISCSAGKNTRENTALRWLALLAGLLLSVSLAGCGGGGNSDSQSTGNTGSAVLGLTDAPGDFLTYTVDVLSIKMVHADGRIVETLPLTTRVDFAQYTDLTEFLTAATVPLGAYKEAIITLDYSHAQIEVEDANGQAVPVPLDQILDNTGKPVTTMQMQVQLDRNVPIAPGLIRYILLDFNLAQSNTVTLNNDNTASITVDPVLSATVEKESPKQHRLRGPLKSVDVTAGTYDLYVRPYFRRILGNTGTYGEFHVNTSTTTVFEIDGITYTGSAGLKVLAAEPQYTAVVAIGRLRLNPLRFEADEVHAGSSVPGGTMDVAKGSVIARSGDVLTLRGVTLVRNDGSVVFNDNVTVSVDSSTTVTKELATGTHTIDEISVGQRITAFGTLTTNGASDLQLSAANGYVRMELSQVRGHVTTLPASAGDPLVMNLTSINGRNPAIYQFSGTQASADSYDVNTGSLDLSSMGVSADVAAWGFPTSFGDGPDDFTAQTLIQYPAMTP